VIWPATETLIKKYTAQERVMVRETEEAFEKIVVPYIESFDANKLDW
jgi:m7GpppX diphosphatase